MDAGKFEIVPVSEDVLDEILRLAAAGGLSHWSKADYLAEIGRDDSIFLQIRETSTKQIAGFVSVRLITINNSLLPIEADILNITIDKDLRNQGLATKLLQNVLRKLETYSKAIIRLEVRRSNTTAIEFYENKGFTLEHLRKNYYSNPEEDAFVMKMDI